MLPGDESTVSGNQPTVSKVDGYLTENFLGETINKSGVSYDRVNCAVGGKREIRLLRRRGASRGNRRCSLPMRKHRHRNENEQETVR